MARKKGEGSFKTQGEYHVWTIGLGADPKTGKAKTKVIKRRDLRELKKLVRQYLRDREDGKPAAFGNSISGDAWAERWLANVGAAKESSTHASYKNTWEKWLQPRLGKKTLEKWGSSDIQAAVNEAIAQDKNRTAIYLVAVARRMLNAAARHKPPYVRFDEGDNPCDGLVLPAAAQERERILSHDEVDEALEELYRWEPYKTMEGGEFVYGHRHAIRFCLETGARRSEACGLQLFSVDLLSDEPEVHIKAQVAFVDGRLAVKPYTKGKRIRTVPLTDAAVEALKEHQKLVKGYRTILGGDYQENMLAFPSEEGTPINPHNMHRTILRLQAAINDRRKGESKSPREPWTLHDLRRTFGTRIAQTGANMKETQTLMGHARMETTAKIYVVAEREGIRKAVRAMKNKNSRLG